LSIFNIAEMDDLVGENEAIARELPEWSGL